MENPLLSIKTLPNFSSILPEHIEPAVKEMINRNRSWLNEILNQSQSFEWDNLFSSLEEMHDQLSKMWSPVSHLHAVAETEELRNIYNICLPLLTEYHTETLQNETLFKAIKSFSDSHYDQLHYDQKKLLDNELRDFKLAGVHLPPVEKARYAELQKQLCSLTTQFGENLLDATQGWSLHITDPNAIKGIPSIGLELAEQNAKNQGKKGWIFTLDYPSYSIVMKYMANRELRWLMYEAYSTRASDQGPNAGKWDNTQIMNQIVSTRHELAQILGFKNYAEYSLATKMAKNPDQVLQFLYDLVKQAKSTAEQEIQELTQFAKELDRIDHLEAWDLAYYSEKMREKQFTISQEELRPYFPIDKVLVGMFTVVNKLFGITINENKNIDTWHPQVQYFEIFDKQGKMQGSFYTDLYARLHKREGAWMDECRVHRQLPNGELQLPVAFLTCNFTRPFGNKPAYLTHDEVLTLFHEFGHCLHHLLTHVKYASISGINGVPWDAVEFPSQFLEFWCWEKETLALISSHETTGEPLPDALFTKLNAIKNFQSGLQMLRQLEFALFDFRLHLEFDTTKGAQIQKILDDVRKQVSVVPTPTFNRFQHSFSHVFSGSYAAGYYSYKWAEVLSSDAYSLFEEKGIFNKEVGESFKKNILEQGGSRDPMELFVAFRGREPKIDALLRHSGLA